MRQLRAAPCGRAERDHVWALILRSGRWQLDLTPLREDLRPLKVPDLKPALAGEHE